MGLSSRLSHNILVLLMMEIVLVFILGFSIGKCPYAGITENVLSLKFLLIVSIYTVDEHYITSTIGCVASGINKSYSLQFANGLNYESTLF